MRSETTKIDFANPAMAEIIEAVPGLCWRVCWDCGHIGLYRDNRLPQCRCRECRSDDTRLLRTETKKLQRERGTG